MSDYRYYLPESGETAEDAREVPGSTVEAADLFAEDAARYEDEQCGCDLEDNLTVCMVMPDGHERLFRVDIWTRHEYDAQEVTR